jgi:hypothetical protein
MNLARDRNQWWPFVNVNVSSVFINVGTLGLPFPEK